MCQFGVFVIHQRSKNQFSLYTLPVIQFMLLLLMQWSHHCCNNNNNNNNNDDDNDYCNNYNGIDNNLKVRV